jgi:hypothetical protein
VRRDIDDAASRADRFGDESAVGGTFPAVQRRRIDRATIERVYVACVDRDEPRGWRGFVPPTPFQHPVVEKNTRKRTRIVATPLSAVGTSQAAI